MYQITQPSAGADPFFIEANAQLSDKGFFVAASDDLITWARSGSDVWSGLLRDRDDADVNAALRRRALRIRTAGVPAAVRRDDRGRDPDQQDGAGAAQGLRPDA
jgi:hypothetical protein